MPAEYERQGFYRHEIQNMIEYEKATGTVHEASNFHPGNEPAEPSPITSASNPEIKRDLINEMREMIASGPITMRESPDVP